MREIKFRAWDTFKEKFYSWEEILQGMNPACIFDGSSIDGVNPRFIPEQFIGTHDKKGREIYEGDVLKVGDKVNLVEWTDKYSSYFFGRDQLSNSFDFFECEREVLGNIHENPELLETNVHESV